MKLLDNVRMYEFEATEFVFRFEDENETHYYLCGKRDYLRKSRTRPLTIDEQVNYLYNLCCRTDSRLGDYFELNEFMAGILANLVPETMLHPDKSREAYIRQNIRYFLVKPERKTKIIDTSKWEMKP